jgi:DNA-binding NtrC family response regulator
MNSAVEAQPFVAQSAVARQLLRETSAVSRSHDPVLIVGGTGVGKTLLARHLHASGRHARQPFVVLQCGALDESALASLADGGTAYLRGLADAARHEKVELLGVVDRLSESGDVRIVASMTREPTLAAPGSVDEELYYRLSGHELRVPSLGARRDDIRPLAERFLAEKSAVLGRTIDGFTAAARDALEEHAWPGNVRELRSCIGRAVVACELRTIDRVHLSFPGASLTLAGATQVEVEVEDLKEARSIFERAHVERILAKNGGDKRRAAIALGIDLSSLYRKIEKRPRDGNLTEPD